MKTLFESTLFALMGGVVTYFALRALAPELSSSQFTNIIGVASIASGAVGGWIVKWVNERKDRP